MVSALSVGVNVALNLALVRVAGFRGLALGTAVAAIVNGALLLWLLRGRIGCLDGRRNARPLVFVTIASMLLCAAALGAEYALDIALPVHGTLVLAVRVF